MWVKHSWCTPTRRMRIFRGTSSSTGAIHRYTGPNLTGDRGNQSTTRSRRISPLTWDEPMTCMIIDWNTPCSKRFPIPIRPLPGCCRAVCRQRIYALALEMRMGSLLTRKYKTTRVSAMHPMPTGAFRFRENPPGSCCMTAPIRREISRESGQCGFCSPGV